MFLYSIIDKQAKSQQQQIEYVKISKKSLQISTKYKSEETQKMHVKGLIYSLISRGQNTILVSESDFSGNFPSISIDVLEHVKMNHAYSQCFANDYTFYLLVVQGFVFLVMAGHQYQQKNAFAFLKSIQQQFFAKYPEQRRNKAVAFSLKQFAKNLKQTMNVYMDAMSMARLSDLKQKLSQLQQIDVHHLQKTFTIEQKISVVPKHSQAIAHQMMGFNPPMSTPQSLKTKQADNSRPWYKNWKIWVGIGSAVIAIVVIIVLCVLLIK